MLQESLLRKLQPQPSRYDLSDHDGLWVRVYPSGVISFHYRYRLHGKLERVTLGQYPTISLKRARILCAHARTLVADGISPATQKQVKRQEAIDNRQAESVQDLANEWMSRYVERERKRPELAREILNANVLSSLGKMKCIDLTRRDVIQMLDKIVDRGARSMANRTLSLMKQMLQFGVERGILSVNVCADIKKKSVGGIEKGRDRNLSHKEIKHFWLKVEKFPTHKSVPIALKILLVTAQRRGEIATAEWRHLDLEDKKLWTIPAANSKNNKEHRVPLSPTAIELFKRLKTLAGKSRYVMPSPQTLEPAATASKVGESPGETLSPEDQEKHFTERAITKAVERHAPGIGMAHWTPHDLRRTASTQLAKLGVMPHIKEKILNHALPSMMAVYDHHDYMDERRAALNQLADKVLEIAKTDDAVLDKMVLDPAPTTVANVGPSSSAQNLAIA